MTRRQCEHGWLRMLHITCVEGTVNVKLVVMMADALVEAGMRAMSAGMCGHADSDSGALLEWRERSYKSSSSLSMCRAPPVPGKALSVSNPLASTMIVVTATLETLRLSAAAMSRDAECPEVAGDKVVPGGTRWHQRQGRVTWRDSAWSQHGNVEGESG
jgi:hypothetical protein